MARPGRRARPVRAAIRGHQACAEWSASAAPQARQELMANGAHQATVVCKARQGRKASAARRDLLANAVRAARRANVARKAQRANRDRKAFRGWQVRWDHKATVDRRAKPARSGCVDLLAN